jgi:hypothetical protein
MRTLIQKIKSNTWFNNLIKTREILLALVQNITALQINTSITGYIDFTDMSNTLISYNDIDPSLTVVQNGDDSVTFTLTNGGFTTNKTIPILPGANVLSLTDNVLQIESSTASQLYFKIEVYV